MAKRYVILDFMHLVHKLMGMDDLTCVVKDATGSIRRDFGELVMCDGYGDTCTIITTYPNYLCKWIWGMSGKGEYNIAVCLEGKSAAVDYYKAKPCFRKTYFDKHDIQYKGGRKHLPSRVIKGCQFTYNTLMQGGVKLYAKEEYEADDMVYTLVQQIKAKDTDTPIDVITNDKDLLPLVDEQVSVYIKTPKMDYNEMGSPHLKGYFQVTPSTWDVFIKNCSEFKKSAGVYDIPYNSLVLYKMIKGDTSDSIPAAIKPYGVKKYNIMMEHLREAKVDFANIFRYGKDFEKEILPVIAKEFDTESLAKMRDIYNGINLRHIEAGEDSMGKKLKFATPTQIEYGKLASALNPLHINISYNY